MAYVTLPLFLKLEFLKISDIYKTQISNFIYDCLNGYAHHHSFNMSVPLKVGRTAPMFVLSFFLHSILFAGSALDSFQCLRSLLIVSFHVFFSLPHPRCPTTSNSVMLLIQPSFLTTCPNQRGRLYLNKVCMLLIPSFLRRESQLVWSFKHTLPIYFMVQSKYNNSQSSYNNNNTNNVINTTNLNTTIHDYHTRSNVQLQTNNVINTTNLNTTIHNHHTTTTIQIML